MTWGAALDPLRKYRIIYIYNNKIKNIVDVNYVRRGVPRPRKESLPSLRLLQPALGCTHNALA